MPIPPGVSSPATITATCGPARRCTREPVGRSAAPAAQAVAQARAGLGQRYLPAGLYPGGKPDPPLRSWKEGMAVRRPVGGANASANLYSLIETAKAKTV